MPRYLIDLTYIVEADSQNEAWGIANSVGLRIDEPDFQLDRISEPDEVDDHRTIWYNDTPADKGSLMDTATLDAVNTLTRRINDGTLGHEDKDLLVDAIAILVEPYVEDD